MTNAGSAAVPTLSVVMTTFRDRPERLRRAVDSILGQTFRDFELIVVFEPNDPNAEELSRGYSDSRLLLERSTEKRGRCGCYNRALDLARGRYIARMDSDDWAAPERFEQQLAFLRDNPGVAVLGTSAVLVDDEDREIGRREVPLTHEAILRSFVFTNPMIHPAIIWDTQLLGRDLRFDMDFSAYCDDLELWLRIARHGGRFANISEALLRYRQPSEYTRARDNWRYNFRARRKHWRLGLKRPMFLVGVVGLGILSILPEALINAITRRSWLSDRFRGIQPGGQVSKGA